MTDKYGAYDPDQHKMRGGWPVKISDVLGPALERVGAKKVMSEARLRKMWKDVVGEQVSSNAFVRRLRGTVLEVGVASDPWSTELTYMAPMIIEKLNAKLGAGTVTQIVVNRQRKERGEGRF